MTVNELMRALKDMPGHAEVVVQAHDQGDYEYDLVPYQVQQADNDFIQSNPELDPATPVVILR